MPSIGVRKKDLWKQIRGVKTQPSCVPAEKPEFGFLNGNEPSVYLLGGGLEV